MLTCPPEMKPLSIIKLFPKTHKAKNRIKENGAIWVVLRQGVMVDGIMINDPIKNDSLFIAPWTNKKNTRWIKKINDPDFGWEDMTFKMEAIFKEAQEAMKEGDTEKLAKLLQKGWG